MRQLRRQTLIWIGAVFCASWLACSSSPPPPPPPSFSEARTVRPVKHAKWVSGHWNWVGKQQRYVWVPGHWTLH